MGAMPHFLTVEGGPSYSRRVPICSVRLSSVTARQCHATSIHSLTSPSGIWLNWGSLQLTTGVNPPPPCPARQFKPCISCRSLQFNHSTDDPMNAMRRHLKTWTELGVVTTAGGQPPPSYSRQFEPLFVQVARVQSQHWQSSQSDETLPQDVRPCLPLAPDWRHGSRDPVARQQVGGDDSQGSHTGGARHGR